MTEQGSIHDPLTISAITSGERARQQFKENLPPRKPLLHLASRNPQDITKVLETVAFHPASFFGLLGIVNQEDCLSLLEQKAHSQLWENIGYFVHSGEEKTIAEVAKKSLGEENLWTITLSLVHLDDQYYSEASVHELVARALSGIKLASALPLAHLPKIFAEYSNFARAETEDFDTHLLEMLRNGSSTFGEAIYNQAIDEGVINASESILADLTIFATKKRNWLSSSDDDERRMTAGSMQIIRRKVGEDRPDIALGNQIDKLMSALGYEYHPDQLYNEYVLKEQYRSSFR